MSDAMTSPISHATTAPADDQKFRVLSLRRSCAALSTAMTFDWYALLALLESDDDDNPGGGPPPGSPPTREHTMPDSRAAD